LNRHALEQNTTLFLTSHDTHDVEKISDRIIVLDKGGIILDSSLAELKKTYLNRTMEEIIQDVYRSAS
jgi:ABC-2 type transport system ATP-binding protein